MPRIQKFIQTFHPCYKFLPQWDSGTSFDSPDVSTADSPITTLAQARNPYTSIPCALYHH
jgi:hypothetical protein